MLLNDTIVTGRSKWLLCVFSAVSVICQFSVCDYSLSWIEAIKEGECEVSFVLELLKFICFFVAVGKI